MVSATHTSNRKKMDHDIWKLTLKLIRIRGMAAGGYAADRAKNALQEGDEVRCQLWCWIKLHIDEFLKMTPDANDTVH